MSRISKKDIGLLMEAGFSEEELGLVDGGVRGIEIYETPDDYFARELIENASEQGDVDLYDEILSPDDNKKERPDTSHKGIYDDHEYDGNEDWLEGVPVNLRPQVVFLKTIKLGKLTIWQRRNKHGDFEWPVKNLKVTIPEDDRARYDRLPEEYKRELWKSYAKDEWKKLWYATVTSLREYEIEGKLHYKTKKGTEINVLVISADNIRESGYTNLPPEARWITMVYFDKGK